MNITVRHAQPADATAVARILNRIIDAGEYTAFDTPISIRDERSYIQNFPTRGVFIVAEQSDQQRVVGFQSMEPFAGYTHAFDHVGVLGTYVDLDCRRQGIAKRLFAATFAAALQKGYRKLFTHIRADNPAALSAYRSQGFMIVGTAQKHALLSGRYIDEIIVERFL